MEAAYQERRIQGVILIWSSAHKALFINPAQKSTVSERRLEKATFPFSLMSMIGLFYLKVFKRKLQHTIFYYNNTISKPI